MNSEITSVREMQNANQLLTKQLPNFFKNFKNTHPVLIYFD